MGLQGADGRRWSLLAPQDVDELVSRQGTAGDGERTENEPLLAAADPDVTPVAPHGQGAEGADEQAVIGHRPTVPGGPSSDLQAPGRTHEVMETEHMEITSRGHRIHYGTAGDRERPTLLLVHGFLQSANRWVEMGYLDAFATRYRAVAVDLLGHGDSDKLTDPDQYTVEGHLEDLEAVLDAEGAATCHLWGYSFGAVLALAMVAARPERTLSTIVGGIQPDLPREIREAVFGPWIDALEAGDWHGFWEAFLPIDPPSRALLEQDNDHQSAAAFMRGMVADTWELGEPGDVPTLVYMGDKEPFFDDARQTAQHLGAEFVVIPGRGHAGAFQDLAAVGPIARAFLEADPAVSSAGT